MRLWETPCLIYWKTFCTSSNTVDCRQTPEYTIMTGCENISLSYCREHELKEACKLSYFSTLAALLPCIYMYTHFSIDATVKMAECQLTGSKFGHMGVLLLLTATPGQTLQHTNSVYLLAMHSNLVLAGQHTFYNTCTSIWKLQSRHTHCLRHSRVARCPYVCYFIVLEGNQNNRI